MVKEHPLFKDTPEELRALIYFPYGNTLITKTYLRKQKVFPCAENFYLVPQGGGRYAPGYIDALEENYHLLPKEIRNALKESLDYFKVMCRLKKLDREGDLALVLHRNGELS